MRYPAIRALPPLLGPHERLASLSVTCTTVNLTGGPGGRWLVWTNTARLGFPTLPRTSIAATSMR
jgi:hypothetical protein